MKKIFAIALALVMVLSMASAFALNNCTTNFAWPCDADTMFCGRGTVEVIPVVKVNNSCGGFDWQLNTCAGVVAGENIHYIIKLNVEANPDVSTNAKADKPQAGYWWDQATLKITGTEVDVKESYKMQTIAKGIDWDSDEAESYYFLKDVSGWIDVTDDDLDLDDVVFTKKVADNAKASKVKVCAELDSYHSGVGTWFYGDYKVEVAVDSLKVTKGSDTFEYKIDGDTETVKASSNDFQAEVNKLFNLNGCTLGTCLTAKNIEKNFGWDSEVEACNTWSSNVASIVDADCVVAIPKTGDVSVVAYAVMAVVAAAGTMLKK